MLAVLFLSIIGLVLMYTWVYMTDVLEEDDGFIVMKTVFFVFFVVTLVFSAIKFTEKKVAIDHIEGKPHYEKQYIYRDTVLIDSTYVMIPRD
jgi:hypothetical protein